MTVKILDKRFFLAVSGCCGCSIILVGSGLGWIFAKTFGATTLATVGFWGAKATTTGVAVGVISGAITGTTGVEVVSETDVVVETGLYNAGNQMVPPPPPELLTGAGGV